MCIRDRYGRRRGIGLTGKRKVRVDVVDDLSEDTSPVDAVDRAEAVSAVDLGIGEESFDNILARSATVITVHQAGLSHLAVIKGAFDSEIVHIFVQHGGHLCLLDRADLALGMHDEDTDILLPAQAIDGGRSSVTTGCANDGQVFPVGAVLALVPAHEKVLKQVTEKLQRHVLERKSRTMKQLQQVQVLALV